MDFKNIKSIVLQLQLVQMLPVIEMNPKLAFGCPFNNKVTIGPVTNAKIPTL